MRHTGPSVGVVVAAGTYRRARRCIVVSSLPVVGNVGTLGGGRVVVSVAVGCGVASSILEGGAQGCVGSPLGAGCCVAVTNRVILVVV